MSSKSLHVVVIGASGDLARKKIFPALFALYSQNYFPKDTHIFGFARSEFSNEGFRNLIMENLTCRYTPDHSCEKLVNDFLAHCFYCQGDYSSKESFLKLAELLEESNHGGVVDDVHDEKANHLFYLAIPPSLFIPTANAIKDANLIHHSDDVDYWTRAVIEKPFGMDRKTSDELGVALSKVFTEDQIYRIDHYLGKEMIQNLMVLRFANQIFNPLWNAKHIRKVDIIWQEKDGVNGRGGYFDKYGIIRDVIQNHLLQIMALLAMEEPISLSAKDVRDRKVELLRSVNIVKAEDVQLGQYTRGKKGDKILPGYRDDETVPNNSLTPTFAKVKLSVNNERWRGVPFTISAGKGLAEKKMYIRIVFRRTPANVFCQLQECPAPNELVIQVQPEEKIFLSIINKEPGDKKLFSQNQLDLTYSSAYAEHVIPEAYESLLLDLLNGEKGLFIRKDELDASWDIFTPVLHYIDDYKIVPEPYPFGADKVEFMD